MEYLRLVSICTLMVQKNGKMRKQICQRKLHRCGFSELHTRASGYSHSQDALKKLIAAYPDKEVNDRETKEAKIQTIATELD